MKCIKAIRPHGMSKKGDILRVDDETAFERVLQGSWIYTSKTEFKNKGKEIKEVTEPILTDGNAEVVEELPKTKKPKFKKGKQK